jgi:hypothetical protein
LENAKWLIGGKVAYQKSSGKRIPTMILVVGYGKYRNVSLEVLYSVTKFSSYLKIVYRGGLKYEKNRSGC